MADPRASGGHPAVHRDGADRGKRGRVARHQPPTEQDEFGVVRSQNTCLKRSRTATWRRRSPVALPSGDDRGRR